MTNIISAITELNFGEALIILLVGILVVFAVLAVMIGFLYIIRYIVNGTDKPKAEKAKVVPSELIQTAKVEDDEEVVAAITAAVTCILQEEANKDGTVVAPFRIKKIKHIH